MEEHSLGDFIKAMVHNHRKILNLILMVSLGTQGLKEFKMSKV